MTSKQRAYLKGLAMNLEPIFQIGKSSLTPEVTEAIGEAFNTKELIKITVLKNCMDDPNEIARMLAERTHAQVVQVIGKKIVLYKESKEHKKIELPKKKVGIMGGTFDPIHYGHLILAQNALDTFSLDEILFVPSGTPWLKESTKVLSKNKRVSMTGMAIEDNPDFALSTIEIDREGNSYSYETVEELKRMQPKTDFYFIMGADSLLEIERWKHPDRLMTECTLLVAVRDDCDREGLEKQIIYLTDKYQADIKILPANRIDISSTKIRRMIREGKSVRYMLPDQVIRFIQKNHLYRQETSSEK